MDDEQQNERAQLLERFRNSLSLPLSERYFDEDELIDIFDDAGDLDDDLIRLEVLSVASRFYPDSEALNQRRCLFYSIISPTAGARLLNIYQEENGPMWQVMRLRQKRDIPGVNMPRHLNKFIAENRHIDDEEVVIQFIRLVAELNEPEWLNEHISDLIAACSNERVVLFEGAVAFETMHRYDLAINLLVKLTDIDPFGYSNWLMLAEQYLAQGRNDEFNNAIDYALALNPEDWQGLYVKGKYLLTKDLIDEACSYFQQCCRLEPDIIDPYRSLAYCLNLKGEKEQAERILRKMLVLFPQEVLNIIPYLLMYNPPDVKLLFEQFFFHNPDNSELFWRIWSDRLWDMGAQDLALAAVNCFFEQTGMRTLNLVAAEYGFRHGADPKEVLARLDEYYTGRDEIGEGIDWGTYYIILVIALAQAGEMKQAKLACLQFYRLNSDPKSLPMTTTLSMQQAIKVLQSVAVKFRANEPPQAFFNLEDFGLNI